MSSSSQRFQALLTLVAAFVYYKLQLVAVEQLLWRVGNQWAAVHLGAVHGLCVGDEYLRHARSCVCSQDCVLARDDRAVDVDVVFGRLQVPLGDILRGAADSKLGVERQVELASLVRIIAVVLPEDYAEGYRIST